LLVVESDLPVEDVPENVPDIIDLQYYQVEVIMPEYL
jgi:hypothetical protein